MSCGGQEPAIFILTNSSADLPNLLEVARILRVDLLIKLSLAVLLGGIIGFEREIAGKPAGLRTNILICIGAALLVDISTRIGLVDGVRVGDPGRIAAQIVSGVQAGELVATRNAFLVKADMIKSAREE